MFFFSAMFTCALYFIDAHNAINSHIRMLNEGMAMHASIFLGLVRTHHPRAEGIVAYVTTCQEFLQFQTSTLKFSAS